MSRTLSIEARVPRRRSLLHRLVATGPSRALASLGTLVDVFVEAKEMARVAYRNRPYDED